MSVGSIHAEPKISNKCPTSLGTDIMFFSLRLLTARYFGCPLLFTKSNNWAPAADPNWIDNQALAELLVSLRRAFLFLVSFFCWSDYFFFLMPGLLTPIKRPLSVFPLWTSHQSPWEIFTPLKNSRLVRTWDFQCRKRTPTHIALTARSLQPSLPSASRIVRPEHWSCLDLKLSTNWDLDPRERNSLPSHFYC